MVAVRLALGTGLMLRQTRHAKALRFDGSCLRHVAWYGVVVENGD